MGKSQSKNEKDWLEKVARTDTEKWEGLTRKMRGTDPNKWEGQVRKTRKTDF